MNLCRTAGLRVRRSFPVVLCALGLALVFAPLLVHSQRSLPRAGQSNQPASTEAVVSQIREAASLLQEGRLADAEPILRQVLLAAPRNPDAHNLLGIVLDQSGQFKAAEREYRAALRLNPSLVSPLANLGVLLARTGRSEEAIRTFEAVLQKVPDHPQATLNLGVQYITRGDFARAMPLLERAAQLNGDNYQVRYNLGLALYNLKRLDEAAIAFDAASSFSGTAPEPFYFLGLIASARGQDGVARELWEKAVTLRPNYAEANFMLGELLQKYKRLESAKDHYARALQQDPSRPIYYARLGGTYILLGNFEQALVVFQRAAERFSQNADMHYFVALAARGTANYELAQTALRKSLSLQPNHVDALALLGAILSDRGDTAAAEKFLRRAIALNDKHFNAYHDLGRLLVRIRRYSEALPVLQRAVTLQPTDADVHYQLYVTLSRLKRNEEADRELTIHKRLTGEQRSTIK